MQQPNISATKPLSITRNGVSITFSPTAFKRGELKINEIQYPGVEVTEETLDDWIKWHGMEDFLPWFNARIAQLHQQVWKAATDDGKKNWSAEDNASYLEKLSTRGETKAVIDAKVKALIADLNNPEILMAMNGNDAGAKLAAFEKFMKISADLKKFSDILDSKKHVKTGDEEEEANEASPQPVNA